MAESDEFAVYASTSPGGILSGPVAADEVPMSAQDGDRGDQRSVAAMSG
jgi:hypothetical protein